MRITTNQLYQNSVNGILETQKKLVRAQDVLIKQSNVLKPSDDPAAATKIVRLDEDLARLEQFEKNTILLENSLENKEVVLGNIHGSMQRARTLAIQAGNGAMNDQDRRAMASELEQIRDELFDLFNSKNGQGEYIFSGSKSSDPAFVKTSNGYEYQGDENVKKIQISETLKLDSGVPGSGFAIFEDTEARSTLSIDTASSTASGSYSVFSSDQFEAYHKSNYVAVPPNPVGSNDYSVVLTSPSVYEVRDNGGTVLDSGNLDSENKFVYAGLQFQINGTTGDQLNFTLDQPNKENTLNSLTSLINTMNNAENTSDDYFEELKSAIYSFDRSMENVSSARSQIGGRLNVVSSVNLSNLDQEINLKEARAKIEEVDFSEAITELQKQETALTVANQTFSKVTGLSLFNFL
ncbi:flagellar hook-associated protein 3 [Saccharobesus litoralis]|uniref:Flagellar hook-associated protein 3 n=1 Tax=Saccharobesus litoralis TaxID=2172099 RepID=A0A2S0VUP4_9ALTE|nr:flagellar hook-associated protein FlgL [Saccharobesus litoralis]AWB67947.1 flagellar hook-associated protein 3 [Saccharobesus litoralis]